MDVNRNVFKAIMTERASASALEQVFREIGLQCQSSGRRNFDGVAASSWLVVAGFTIKMAPDVLRAFADFLTRNDVKSIEINDIKIVNPRPEDVNRLLLQLSDIARQGEPEQSD